MLDGENIYNDYSIVNFKVWRKHSSIEIIKRLRKSERESPRSLVVGVRQKK